jgi:hypothetical protein
MHYAGPSALTQSLFEGTQGVALGCHIAPRLGLISATHRFAQAEANRYRDHRCRRT